MTEEGDFYSVMELLEGLSLERLVREFGAVDPERTVFLLRQVCHSLGEAHARGLVRRDVKPANIMVCRLGPDDSSDADSHSRTSRLIALGVSWHWLILYRGLTLGTAPRAAPRSVYLDVDDLLHEASIR